MGEGVALLVSYTLGSMREKRELHIPVHNTTEEKTRGDEFVSLSALKKISCFSLPKLIPKGKHLLIRRGGKKP